MFPQFKENPIKRCDPASAQDARERAPRQGNVIKLPKIGGVAINLHRPIPEGFNVKGVRIVSRARGAIWYAVVTIQCDVKVPQFKPYGHAVGVDIGLESFLVTSDNFRVKPARFFRDLQSRLKELQRKVSRKKKRSKNYEKAQIEVAKLHHKISNSRKNFHLDIAHKLCDRADSIYVEDLDFRVSAKGFLGKEMLDGGFGQFRQLLSWVCWKRGKYMEQVEHKYTSQICPECGTHTGKKELGQREHNCSECSYSTSRDHASARVILNRGLEINVVPRDAGERKQPADCVLSGSPAIDKCNAGIS